MHLYPWTLWLHVFFATLFFFVHGTAMAIAFRLPVEKDPKTLHALLNIIAVQKSFFQKVEGFCDTLGAK